MITIPDFLDGRMRRLLRDIMARDGKLSPEGWVVRKLEYPDGTIDVASGPNLVTNAGDLWYAQKVAGDTPTNTFTNCVLGTGGNSASKTSTYTSITPISGSSKAVASGYPARDDSDVDNTGAAADSITWKFSWGAGDFNQGSGITEGVITIGSPTTGSPLLAMFAFSPSFGKDSSTTLTLYVNHNFLGA